MAVPFLVAIDVFNRLDRGGTARYALLFIPVIPLVLYRLRRPSTLLRRPAVPDLVLFALFAIGMVGSTYGSVVMHISSSAREVFLPMGLAFLYLFMLETPTEEEVGRILRMLTLIGALYIFLAAVVNIGALPFLLKYQHYRNAHFALVTMGLGASIVTRRQRLLLGLVFLELVNFAGYPSATSLVGILIMIVTLFVTRPSASTVRPYVVALIAACALAFALANLHTVVSGLGDYFHTVGKVNATSGRLALWQSGFHQFRQSPIIGNAFSQGTVTTAIRPNGHSIFQLPFHDDFVLFLAEGGIIGIGLLVLLIGSAEVALLRRYRWFLQNELISRARLVRLYLIVFNTFVITMAFNPTLEGLSRGAMLWSLYALVMTLGRPAANNLRGLAPVHSHIQARL